MKINRSPILPVVILYNMDLYDSNVYKSLLCQYPSMSIVVYDNSPDAHEISDKNIIYFHDENNGGVSAGYNYAAKEARKSESFSFLLLLDQDTIFSSDYIKKLENAIVELPNIDVFVPIVFFNGNMVFSPYKRSLFVGNNVVLGEGKYSLKRYLPVNSGACIRLKAFNQIDGYNPSIMLDFADIDFFSRLCQVSDEFYLLNSNTYQNFSNNETDYAKLKKRFSLFLQSGNAARENTIINKWVRFTMLKHAIALSLRTMNLYFIYHFFKGN